MKIFGHRRPAPPPTSEAGTSPAAARRRRTRRQRGATIIEAAIVTPVLFSLLLGVMEIGLASADYLGLGNAVRAGARTSSAAGADLGADFLILGSINRESTALKRGDITKIVIYRATAIGDAPSAACQTGSVTGSCNFYTPTDFNRPKTDFGCLGTSPDRFWCPSTRKVSTTTTGPDYIGVWMQVNHRWISKAWGNTKTFTDSTVIRLEPRVAT